MDGFFGNLVNKASEKYLGGSSHQGGPQEGLPPQPPYPWRAQWDENERRYFFINEQTGERSREFPSGGGGYGGDNRYGGGSSGPQGYGGGGYEENRGAGYGGGYGGPPQQGSYGDEYRGEEHQKKDHNGLKYGALGAAAGLAGGAFLMHEGEEAKEDWDQDKYRAEQGLDNFGRDVENAPEDAARWTGEKVGEVEDIPNDIDQSFDRFGDRVERKWDNAVDDVEDAPEDAANWVGDKVGDAERFGDDVQGYGDRLDNAYDDGRNEGRYDD